VTITKIIARVRGGGAWFLAALLASSAPTFGAERDPTPGSTDLEVPPLLLATVLEQARRKNPEINAADARAHAMGERPIQQGTLPDPTIGAKYHNESFDGFTLGDSEFTYYEFSVEQEIPFPGKLGLRQSIAERGALREQAMRDATLLAVLARAAVAYFDLAVVDRSIELLRESRSTLEILARQAETAYSVGIAAQQDLLRATQERTDVDVKLTAFAQKRIAAESSLNALLDRPPDAPLASAVLPPAPPPSRPLAELQERLRERAPELKAAHEDVLAASDGVDLAQREYLPDFAVMGAYSNKSRLEPEWEVGLAVRVPLYFWRRQRPALAEADWNRIAAEHTRRNTQVTLEARLRELHSMAEASSKVVALYSERLIPQAELTLESARSSYAVGKVDFMTVLNAFLSVLDYRMRVAEETGALHRARAEIASILGETPLGEPIEAAP